MPSAFDLPTDAAGVGDQVWRAAAQASNVSICLSDPTAPDEPLVWVNDAFTTVTGYTAAQAVGRNCRFLQGPDTDTATVTRIRDRLRRHQPVVETLLNYRRDGRPFWNRLSLSPLTDDAGQLIHYVGVQDNVTVQFDALRARDTALDQARRSAAEFKLASLREHQAALQLQTGLLPRLRPVPGLDVAARYIPATAGASVGGDWYDIIELPDHQVAIAVGDVMGHDPKAAAAMGQLRSMTRALAWSDPAPASVLQRLDSLARTVLDVSFATAFYGLLTPLKGNAEQTVLTWSRAGHPPPLLRTPTGQVTRLDDVINPPIGVIAGRPVNTASTILQPGAMLVLYTDGLIETRQQTLDDGIANLTRAITNAPAHHGPQAVCDAIAAALVPAQPPDDTCLLIVTPSP